MVGKRLHDPKKRLVGTWKCCDGFSDTRINIKVRAGIFAVSVLHKYDGEQPRVYDITWNDRQQELSFAVHWSSGRFVRYRFTPSLVEGRLDLTFSYTAQELWERGA